MMRDWIIGGSVALGLVTATAVVALGAPQTATASASAIRECGSYGLTRNATAPKWTYGEILGATRAANLTTRAVACSTARRFALRYRGTDSYFPSWRCRETNDFEFSDVRCSASRGRVIHWQAGS